MQIELQRWIWRARHGLRGSFACKFSINCRTHLAAGCCLAVVGPLSNGKSEEMISLECTKHHHHCHSDTTSKSEKATQLLPPSRSWFTWPPGSLVAPALIAQTCFFRDSKKNSRPQLRLCVGQSVSEVTGERWSCLSVKVCLCWLSHGIHFGSHARSYWPRSTRRLSRCFHCLIHLFGHDDDLQSWQSSRSAAAATTTTPAAASATQH